MNHAIEYLKKQEIINIFWKKGEKDNYILVCQSSGKNFMADLELLKIENYKNGTYKVCNSQICAVIE